MGTGRDGWKGDHDKICIVYIYYKLFVECKPPNLSTTCSAPSWIASCRERERRKRHASACSRSSELSDRPNRQGYSTRRLEQRSCLALSTRDDNHRHHSDLNDIARAARDPHGLGLGGAGSWITIIVVVVTIMISHLRSARMRPPESRLGIAMPPSLLAKLEVAAMRARPWQRLSRCDRADDAHPGCVRLQAKVKHDTIR